jgi:hypothetical protein
MSEHSALLAQLRASRLIWIEVAEGKSVQFLRPLEAEVGKMVRAEGGRSAFRLDLEDLKRCAVDWKGFTEADLLGKGIGNDDPIPFDAEVLALALGDNLDWLQAAVEKLATAIGERMSARLAARGNSSATSTPTPAATTVAT